MNNIHKVKFLELHAFDQLLNVPGFTCTDLCQSACLDCALLHRQLR